MAARRRPRRRRRRRLRYSPVRPVAYVVIAVVVGVLVAVALPGLFPPGDYVELDTIEIFGEELLLGAECKGVVGRISAERGVAIQQGLDNELDNRPNIYDVFRDATEVFDVKVESVRITRIENNNFLSVLTFSSGDKIFEADARPSDAIALALRTNSTILFNRTFLEEIGSDICSE